MSYLFSKLTPEQKAKLEALVETAKKGRDSAEYQQAMVEYAKYAQSPEGKGLYSLPTEAQWEYAARGRQQFIYGTVDGTLSHDNAIYGSDQTADVGCCSQVKCHINPNIEMSHQHATTSF
jgi:hypothetical protein